MKSQADRVVEKLKMKIGDEAGNFLIMQANYEMLLEENEALKQRIKELEYENNNQ